MCRTRIAQKTIFMIILVVLVAAVPGASLRGADEAGEIFDRARLALFDRQWDRALTELNRLEEKFPNSRYASEVLFYRGKCYEEKKAASKALENYSAFLQVSQNESLKEEATRGIIDLNFMLYEKSGNKKYLAEIARFLKSKNLFLRYFAAFKLSYAKDKKAASGAVPVLREIIKDESDRELVDRAKLALLRIDPGLLKKSSRAQGLENQVLKIRIIDKKTGKDSISLNIPFILARLAMSSLPEKEKKTLTDKGYNLDNILDRIVETGEIFRIDGDDVIFRIWIEPLDGRDDK